MTLLEDARAIVVGAVDAAVMERILAALEAAERLTAPQPEPPEDAYSEVMGVPADAVRSVDADAYDALVAALRGKDRA